MCTWLKDDTDALQRETDDLQDATTEIAQKNWWKPEIFKVSIGAPKCL